MNRLRRYSRMLAPSSVEMCSEMDQDAETGNESGQKSLEASREQNPYVLPEIPTTPAFDHDSFSTTKQEPPIPAPSEEALEAHTAFTNLTADGTITEARILENITTPSQALDNPGFDTPIAQAHAPEYRIPHSQVLDNAIFESASTQARALDDIPTPSQARDNPTFDTATAQTYAPENRIVQPQALDNSAFETAATQAYAPGNQLAHFPTLDNATFLTPFAQAYAPENRLAHFPTRDNTTFQTPTAQAYAPENSISQAHGSNNATSNNPTAQVHAPENPISQAHGLNNVTSDRTIVATHTLENIPISEILVTQARALNNAAFENAVVETHTPENLPASETLTTQARAPNNAATENAIVEPHTLDNTPASGNLVAQARALNNAAFENASVETHFPENIPASETLTTQARALNNAAFENAIVDTHTPENVLAPGTLTTQARALNNAAVENVIVEPHTRENVPAPGTLITQARALNNAAIEHLIVEPHAPENASTHTLNSEDEFADDEAEILTELDEEALRRLPPALRNTMQAIQRENRERLMREGEPEEGPSRKDKGKGKAREPEGPEGTYTSSDETSICVSVMDELAHEDSPAGVNHPNPLGSNPVTDEDRDWIAEIYRRNEAVRREAARSRPVGTHRGNVGSHSDIVPMRQWREEARRAGIPTSPDRPEGEGTPARSSVLSNLRRPLEAITGRAAAAVAFVRGKLQGRRGKGKGKGKGPEGPEEEEEEEGPVRRGDLVVGSSYKTRPSGRRNPAAPNQGPPPGLHMTMRGHVEDYTI